MTTSIETLFVLQSWLELGVLTFTGLSGKKQNKTKKTHTGYGYYSRFWLIQFPLECLTILFFSPPPFLQSRCKEANYTLADKKSNLKWLQYQKNMRSV